MQVFEQVDADIFGQNLLFCANVQYSKMWAPAAKIFQTITCI